MGRSTARRSAGTGGAALLAGGLIGFSAPAAWAAQNAKAADSTGGTSAAPASGSTAPAGNNGHIQIDQFVMDGGRGNEPHVGCGFSVSFFGYDGGSRNATVSRPHRGGSQRFPGIR